ncbi:SubName: Full=Related to kinesin light chain {ECO:0000313/EMBL:CCA74951.1}, partial [Serendipita indica DSM 11827]
MSDTRSHWKKILYPSSSSGNIDPPHLLADLNISKASSSKSTSKIDSLGFLDVASGTDPIV